MNVGLVLSGGMAKGAYQVGALRALDGILPASEVKAISCASVGVLNGYAYACGKLPLAERLWQQLCCEDTRFVITQILRSSLLQQNISQLYSDGDTLSAAFFCALLNLPQKSMVYKELSAEKANIPRYLKASVAMPIYNRAVQIDGVSYFDGAMVDNIPVFPLLQQNLDYIICFYFDDTCYQFESACFDSKIIKITFPCAGVLKRSVVFQQGAIAQMLRDGYEVANSVLRGVFAEGYDNLDYIYRWIDRQNRSASRSLRITGDVLVTNLNKITQRLTHKRIL